MADVLEFLGRVKMPEFRRGSGPDRLPYGQAQAMNQAAAAVPDSPRTAQEAPGAPQAPGMAPGSNTSSIGPYKPQNDLEAFVTSASRRPSESIFKGITASGALAPPPDLENDLPIIQRAALTPGAPIQLQLILDLLMAHRR